MSTSASTPPADRLYSATHQWARDLTNGQVEIGITAHAQDALGDIVFVDLPKLGAKLIAGESFMVIESVKTASDVHAPVSGTVVEVNESLREQPESLNIDPYGRWLVRVAADSEARAGLLQWTDYADSVAGG